MVMERLTEGLVKCGCCVAVLAVAAAALLPLFVTIVTFIYAFINPDSLAWYGKVDGQSNLFVSELAAREAAATEIKDIH